MRFPIVERLCNLFVDREVKSNLNRSRVQVEIPPELLKAEQEIENKRRQVAMRKELRLDEAETYCYPDTVVNCWSFGCTGCSDIARVYLTKSLTEAKCRLLCMEKDGRWFFLPTDVTYRVKHGVEVATVSGYRRYVEGCHNCCFEFSDHHYVPLHIIEAHLRAEVPDMTCYVKI